MDDKKLDEIFDAGHKAFKEDREPAAVELLRVFLKCRPDYAPALFFYAAALQDIGLRKESEQIFLKALKITPANKRYVIQARLGKLFYDQGKTNEAEKWFSLACKSKGGKNLGWLWIERGTNYLRARKLKRAEECLLAATKMDESDINEAYYNLGNIYRMQGKYKEAKSAYFKALKIDPGYAPAREALDSLKDIGKAIRKANSLKSKRK